MRTQINRILNPSVLVNFPLCFITVPNDAQKVLNLELHEGIVSEQQVIDLCGEDSEGHKFYKAFIKEDKKQEAKLNLILVPAVSSGVTPTVYTITYAGTTVDAGKATLRIEDTFYNFNYTSATTPALIAAGLKALIDDDTKCNFTATVSTADLILTAKYNFNIFDSAKILATFNTTGFTAAVVKTESVNTPNIDDIATLMDTTLVMHRMYGVQYGLDRTPLLEKLKLTGNMDNIDLSGIILDYRYGTYAGLIETAKELNNEFYLFGGYKQGFSTYTVNELIGAHLGAYGVLFTDGANCSSIRPDSPTGNINKISEPQADAVITSIPCDIKYNFSLAERAGLEDSGVYTGYCNTVGNYTIGTLCTTRYKLADGKPNTTYKFGEAILQSIISFSYFLQILKNKFGHRRFDNILVTDVLSEMEFAYDVLSNVKKDPTTGDSYYMLDSRGKDDFSSSLKKNTNTNYVTGVLTFDQISQTLVSQLRSIVVNISDKYYIGE